jgi:rhamnogalacturonyl hydrolase YesR
VRHPTHKRLQHADQTIDAVGDAAAIGVAAIMIGATEPAFLSAADRQVNHLLNVAPRFWNGAISHREEVPELWADFVYMVPPVLAYYAKATNNASILAEAVRQCGLYRDVLRDNTTAPYAGLWEHIVGPNSPEHGLWSTGNGWAASGMARVLGTVVAWPGLENKDALAKDVSGVVKEILDGAMAVDRDDGLLRNYLNDSSWFGEVTGTAALAAAAYRVAVLAPDIFGRKYVAWADESRAAIVAHTGANGILAPAVNPLNWLDRTPAMKGSPEGQAIAVVMYAAYRDCVCAGVCEASTAPATSSVAVPSSTITSSSSLTGDGGTSSGSVPSATSTAISASLSGTALSAGTATATSSSVADNSTTMTASVPGTSVTSSSSSPIKVLSTSVEV